MQNPPRVETVWWASVAAAHDRLERRQGRSSTTKAEPPTACSMCGARAYVDTTGFMPLVDGEAIHEDCVGVWAPPDSP